MLLQKAPGVSTPEELLHQLTQLQREVASATSALGNRNTEIRELQGACAPLACGEMHAHKAAAQPSCRACTSATDAAMSAPTLCDRQESDW